MATVMKQASAAAVRGGFGRTAWNSEDRATRRGVPTNGGGQQ
jgi:hypothetical protein